MEIKCGLGTLAPGASRTVTVDLRPTAAGRLTLTGTVSAAEPDTVPPNDTDQAAVTVGLATVELSATADPRVLPGATATTITINAVTRSRRPARNARVCVQLPRGLTVKTPPRATLRGRRLCWRITRLAAGARRTYRLHAVAPRVTRARRLVLRLTVRGAGVRTRRARVTLRILAASAQPPRVTG